MHGYALAILVVETSGPICTAQLPGLVLWFHTLQFGDRVGDARVAAFVRPPEGGPWEQHVRSVSREESDEVMALLSELGIPGRDLHVSGKIDTSDVSSTLLLRVRLNDREYTLDLDMLASGFEGEDAEALRRLPGKLRALASGR